MYTFHLHGNVGKNLPFFLLFILMVYNTNTRFHKLVLLPYDDNIWSIPNAAAVVVVVNIIIIIIIIIIILGISFMQGICTYIPETNHVPGEHHVATILM